MRADGHYHVVTITKSGRRRLIEIELMRDYRGGVQRIVNGIGCHAAACNRGVDRTLCWRRSHSAKLLLHDVSKSRRPWHMKCGVESVLNLDLHLLAEEFPAGAFVSFRADDQ